ncbi:MAG: multinuclear nonheme iron-dependent oxidase [Methylococcaceae bacterium]
MKYWDLHKLPLSFIEVAPENWIRRDTQRLLDIGIPVTLHGVSLNLGGCDPLDIPFVKSVGRLMDELHIDLYSDHLASSGHQGHLYDLFPVIRIASEAERIADRIKTVQDTLGRRIAIENPTTYISLGDIPDHHFLSRVAQTADCNILLDLNNIVVNYKNLAEIDPVEYVESIDRERITYCHVAGHYWNHDLKFYIDSHSRHPDQITFDLIHRVNKPKLLEWDNNIPDIQVIEEELWKISTHS